MPDHRMNTRGDLVLTEMLSELTVRKRDLPDLVRLIVSSWTDDAKRALASELHPPTPPSAPSSAPAAPAPTEAAKP